MKMPIDDKVLNAFRRVSHLSTETVGDMCKDDLVKLGIGLGLSDSELQQQFPNLYERSVDVPVTEIAEEDETYNLDSLGNTGEDEKIDEENS